MYSVPQGKALMKSPAKRRRPDGDTWNGWCGAWVYWFTGADRSFATATHAFLATKIVSKAAADAPAGAIHYWTSRDSDQKPGHVAVSLGAGIAAMASSRVTTSWGADSGTIAVAAYNRQTSAFMKYEGWSYDFGGQRMVGVKTLAEVKKAAKATPARYVVVSKDTLTKIATRFKVPVARLVALNHIADPDKIRAGVSLRLK